LGSRRLFAGDDGAVAFAPEAALGLGLGLGLRLRPRSSMMDLRGVKMGLAETSGVGFGLGWGCSVAFSLGPFIDLFFFPGQDRG